MNISKEEPIFQKFLENFFLFDNHTEHQQKNAARLFRAPFESPFSPGNVNLFAAEEQSLTFPGLEQNAIPTREEC